MFRNERNQAEIANYLKLIQPAINIKKNAVQRFQGKKGIVFLKNKYLIFDGCLLFLEPYMSQ